MASISVQSLTSGMGILFCSFVCTEIRGRISLFKYCQYGLIWKQSDPVTCFHNLCECIPVLIPYYCQHVVALGNFHIWSQLIMETIMRKMPSSHLLVALPCHSLVSSSFPKWPYFISHLFTITAEWKLVSWTLRTSYLFPMLKFLRMHWVLLVLSFLDFSESCWKLHNTRWLQISPRVRILWHYTKSSWWAVVV
jgi:hypothetical protein